jgi:hypothetical protein
MGVETDRKMSLEKSEVDGVRELSESFQRMSGWALSLYR